ncbi:hypothetical protein [Desulfosporosinus sp. FKA]|uniref:hypothetical protein n=1 Tax=Desulfosporosinus sp. FKA TaxID=1969834 RepID=UPI000B49F480
MANVFFDTLSILFRACRVSSVYAYDFFNPCRWTCCTSNQLGEFESGLTASWLGTVPAVFIGGIGTIVVALLWMKLFPELLHIDKLEVRR